MRHPSTCETYTYWNRLRKDKEAPERSQIEPSDIREILKDIFILKIDGLSDYRFHLIGSRLSSLFQLDLGQKNILTLFDQASVEALQNLFHSVCFHHSAGVLGLVGKDRQGRSMPLEMLLLPLRFHGHTNLRVFGSFVPLAAPAWLQTSRLCTLQLSSVRVIHPTMHRREISRPLSIMEEQLKPTPIIYKGARRVGRFQVIDGGKSTVQRAPLY